MKKKLLTALCVAALIMAGGGSAFAAETATKHTQEAKKKSEAMKKSEAKKKSEAMKVIKGSYSEYDPSKFANAEHGTVILNFSASWCPSCVEADKNFNASPTPEGLTLLKVDYDTSTDLKRKYGVTYQHTFFRWTKLASYSKNGVVHSLTPIS